MSKSKKKATTRPLDKRDKRPEIDHLVVIRESDRHDRVLMEGMIQQTLSMVSHLAGAAKLSAAGLDVLDHPERFGGTSRTSGSSRMVTVEREGVLYLYSMGSAAKDDLDAANAFVEFLIGLVEAYRPTHVWAAAFTRLVRSVSQVGNLYRAFYENIQTIHCETKLDITTPEGQMMFQVFAMIASAERDYIVRRHTAGRVTQWKRQEWIPNAYPPGYRIQDQKLVLDHTQIKPVQEMLRILADRSLTNAQCATKIGALGVTTPKLVAERGANVTVADARSPSSIIRTLVGWADTYETGRHVVPWPNPFPGVEHVSGVPVEDDPSSAHGVLNLTYDLALPEDGWADDATFSAVKTRFDSQGLTGGASHTHTPPLSGMFNFVRDGYEYNVLATEPRRYNLSRRPEDPQRRFKGWTTRSGEDVERIGTVSREALHRSIADGIIAAVATGLPAQLDQHRFQASGPLPQINPTKAKMRGLKTQLADLTTNLRRAHRNANLAEDPETAALFINNINDYLDEQTRIKKQLQELEDTLEEPTLAETFETQTQLVTHAIAALANTKNRADTKLREALRTIISNETWTEVGDNIQWELHIELPHPEGTIILGPITGQVPNRKDNRDGSSIKYRQHQQTRHHLTKLGIPKQAARSAAAYPNPLLVELLIAHQQNRPYPTEITPELADHLIATYTNPNFGWAPGRWRLADQTRQQLLTLVSQAQGTLTQQQLKNHGYNKHQLRHATRKTPGAHSGDPILTHTGRGPTSLYQLTKCPHCDGWCDHSIVTPETLPGVLCTTCWRTPNPNSPTFPDWYRTMLN